MSKNKSYKKSLCCGGKDCDFLDYNPDEPCWGEVELTSCGDDEDGWPIPGHLCQGHREVYEYHNDRAKSYYPEGLTNAKR